MRTVLKHLSRDELQREVLVVRYAVPGDGRTPVEDFGAHVVVTALRLDHIQWSAALILLLLMHEHERLLLIERSPNLLETIARPEVLV